jgi:hypothetical protein
MDIYQPITAVYIKARNFATVRRDGVVYTFPIKRQSSMRHLFSNSQSEAAKIASGAKFLFIRTCLPITSHNLSLSKYDTGTHMDTPYLSKNRYTDSTMAAKGWRVCAGEEVTFGSVREERNTTTTAMQIKTLHSTSQPKSSPTQST